MRAMQLTATPQGLRLLAAELPTPHPAPGEVLVRVCAAGVTPTELIWYPTTHTNEGAPRKGAVPGHEFSGVVAAVGAAVNDVRVGDAVYGMNDWFAQGATAEFCVTAPASLAHKPARLTHSEAAAAPIGALTAWQGLVQRAQVQPGDRVLVHGGAGAVGAFAVQIARMRGAHVLATVAEKDLDFVRSLGAAEAIDYKATRFEDAVGAVDVVFDTVGGETLKRSWAVLRPDGRLATIAAEVENTRDVRAKEAFFIVTPDRGQLEEIARLIDAGQLRVFVKAEVPLAKAGTAYEGKLQANGKPGKVVVNIAG